MFGELIGLTLAQTWMDQGKPARIVLAELGPGRGTLMSDILRSAMRGAAPTWHDHADQLPDDCPLYLVANEFFDALPIRQIIRDGDAWRERQIGLENDQLTFGLSAPAPLTALAHRLEDTKDGDLVEFCPQANPILQSIAQRIDTQGGAALIFDYGDWRSLGDTLQALHAHDKVNPLHKPGQSDLTAHVDFEALIANLPCTH